MWNAFVFVAPENELEEIGKSFLFDKGALVGAKGSATLLRLMQHQDVEPVTLGSLELDLFLLESEVKSLVLHIADSV